MSAIDERQVSGKNGRNPLRPKRIDMVWLGMRLGYYLRAKGVTTLGDAHRIGGGRWHLGQGINTLGVGGGRVGAASTAGGGDGTAANRSIAGGRYPAADNLPRAVFKDIINTGMDRIIRPSPAVKFGRLYQTS